MMARLAGTEEPVVRWDELASAGRFTEYEMHAMMQVGLTTYHINIDPFFRYMRQDTNAWELTSRVEQLLDLRKTCPADEVIWVWPSTMTVYRLDWLAE